MAQAVRQCTAKVPAKPSSGYALLMLPPGSCCWQGSFDAMCTAVCYVSYISICLARNKITRHSMRWYTVKHTSRCLPLHQTMCVFRVAVCASSVGVATPCAQACGEWMVCKFKKPSKNHAIVKRTCFRTPKRGVGRTVNQGLPKVGAPSIRSVTVLSIQDVLLQFVCDENSLFNRVQIHV